MNIKAKLKRLLEDRKHRIVDLKPGHAYFLWIKDSDIDLPHELEPMVRELNSMDIEMFVVVSEEVLLIECKD